jgi:hypothetical protein
VDPDVAFIYFEPLFPSKPHFNNHPFHHHTPSPHLQTTPKSSNMASRRLITLTARASHTPMRQFHHARPLLSLNDRGHPNTSTHRTAQTEKPLNPHLTNTTSTIGNDMPSAGKHSAPPELLSSVDGAFKPKDDAPGNTERMTGGTQKSAAGVAGEKGTDQELNVGEMEGASFKVEPLRRVGEDASTMRARLLCSFFFRLRTQTYSQLP